MKEVKILIVDDEEKNLILLKAMLMTETFYIAAILFSLERALAREQQLRAGRRPDRLLLLGFDIP